MTAREVFVWDKESRKMVPVAEYRTRQHANVAHGYIPDEMPATKHPVDGHYYTSKAKFREVTRNAGCDEVGNDYAKGYEPEAKLEREAREFRAARREELRKQIYERR